MINGLQTLIELQEVQLSIQKEEDCLKRVPGLIEDLQHQLSDLEQELEQAETKVEELRKQRRSLESEVERIKEKLRHFRSQLMEVKTNKEYQAVLKEIALAEEEIAEAEDRILEQMLAIDEKNEQVSDVRNRLEERQSDLSSQRVDLEDQAAEAKQRLEVLVQDRDELTGQIPPELKALYDRIAAARNGRAMAEVRDGSCQVCNVRLRPQLSAELKTNTQKILTCESCNRILYIRRSPVVEKPASN